MSQPAQYLGNEINIVRKDLKDIDVRAALVFPDVYKVGMSYMGFPILYHILNQQPGVYAERAFSPWVDMEALMREKNVPLFSLETFSPLSAFDIVGFTFQYELHFTTMLNLLDLAGIPVEAKDRKGFPIIIGGGPSAFNPEPVADFFDVILIGDGEEAVVEIAECVREAKQSGLSRKETLRMLAAIKGVYVPSFYQPDYDEQGRFSGLSVIEQGAPSRIRSRTISEIRNENYPEKPLVPMIQTTHDRISLEIARGCSRGCRFCNAGMVYRPVRQRTPEELVAQAKKNIDATGYEEISLVSLSTSDYTRLGELMIQLRQTFAEDNVNISFPSLRPESFTTQVAQFAKGVRKSGLTLAPEAGSQRLRDVINKATTSEELLRAVDLAFSEGWNLVKLYFMIGHPTETQEDIEGLVELIRQVRYVSSRYRGKRINISVSPFIPKSMTPFQWVAQDSMQETSEKLAYIASNVRSKNIKLSWRDPDIALVEGMIARGDRRVGRIIKRAWELGAKLEGWSEFFDFSYYQQAVEETGLSFEQFTRGFELEQPLPWDHLDKGVTKKFLLKDYRNALAEQKVEDCRFSICNSCGLMGHAACKTLIQKQQDGDELEMPIEFQHIDIPEAAVVAAEPPVDRNIVYMRLLYRRGQEVRFLSHLDVLRLFERALRRARIPIVFTQGFNPHPKLSFGPSLATGLTSDAEYVDLQVYDDGHVYEIAERLAAQLPKGVDILTAKKLEKKAAALASIVNRADYECLLESRNDKSEIENRFKAILDKKELLVQRKKKKEIRTIDVRPYIDHFEVIKEGFWVRTAMKEAKSVRISEVLSLMFPDDDYIARTALVHRAALWVKAGENFIHPLDAA